MKVLDVSDPASAVALEHALRAGELAIVPTETVYGLLARSDDAEVVERVRQVKGQRTTPFASLVASLETVEASGASLPARARRLAVRYWPGPLTLVLDCGEESVGYRVPGHEFTRGVLERLECPVLATSANRSGEPPPVTFSEAVNQIGEDVTVAVRDGPAPLGEASTVVRIDRSGAASLLREGILSWAEVERTMNRTILFVCTGNTCRSPMAEALCRQVLSERLGCEPRDLNNYGWVVGSAGVGASDGEPAAANAVATAGERGLDLSGHSSRYASPELIASVDFVVALSGGHVRSLENSVPGVGDKLRLLDPKGVPDPIGGSLDVYRRCAAHIEGCLNGLLDEILEPA